MARASLIVRCLDAGENLLGDEERASPQQIQGRFLIDLLAVAADSRVFGSTSCELQEPC